jgi:hypothetical protein
LISVSLKESIRLAAELRCEHCGKYVHYRGVFRILDAQYQATWENVIYVCAKCDQRLESWNPKIPLADLYVEGALAPPAWLARTGCGAQRQVHLYELIEA